MPYVDPALRAKFESLSIDLKDNILKRDPQINTVHDLMAVLSDIIVEDEVKKEGKSLL